MPCPFIFNHKISSRRPFPIPDHTSKENLLFAREGPTTIFLCEVVLLRRQCIRDTRKNSKPPPRRMWVRNQIIDSRLHQTSFW
ncbi:hypothetical protein CEXT_376801 [Caerostris extrusa]|uniref:Ycf15 n=1 Tax=Caerostris extrusa TaxID=172846 RepID=A0AAV4MJQ8_CAEEX|nr:hypothetical protein CEXT_376801 [Caerostris extrusa]